MQLWIVQIPERGLIKAAITKPLISIGVRSKRLVSNVSAWEIQLALTDRVRHSETITQAMGPFAKSLCDYVGYHKI